MHRGRTNLDVRSIAATLLVAVWSCAIAAPSALAQTPTTSIYNSPSLLAFNTAVPPPEYAPPSILNLTSPSSSTDSEPRLDVSGTNLLPAPQFGDDAYRVDLYEDWTPQLLPEGLIYRSYLGGVKESRLGTTFDYMQDFGWIWDINLGGRVGLFRFGTSDPVRPEGFQIDVEGAGQPRLNMENNQDLMAVDFRAGLPITYGIGPWQTKLAYYHLSSHLGDEYAIQFPGYPRINYVRDVIVLGQSYYVTPDVRLYGEVGWAFYTDVSEPWEFQFGVDYSPLVFDGLRGSPFLAVNTQLRQELNFSGNFVAQAGWQWRGKGRGQLFRIGAQYYNGASSQYQFYDIFENRIGVGMWYDY